MIVAEIINALGKNSQKQDINGKEEEKYELLYLCRQYVAGANRGWL